MGQSSVPSTWARSRLGGHVMLRSAACAPALLEAGLWVASVLRTSRPANESMAISGQPGAELSGLLLTCRRGALPEPIGLRIPEVTGKPQSCEDLAHLTRLRSSRGRLQASCVPRRSKFPQLVHPDQGLHWIPLFLAPLTNLLFRPEEEHPASGEDDVIPPVCRRHHAVEQPIGLRRTNCGDL